MTPLALPVMFGIGILFGWTIKPDKNTQVDSRPKDGDPHPSGDGRRWSQFWNSWDSRGRKP